MDRSNLFPSVYRAEMVVRDVDKQFRTIDNVILNNRKKLLSLEYNVTRHILNDKIKLDMDEFVAYGVSSSIETLEEFEKFMKRYDILISKFKIEFIYS